MRWRSVRRCGGGERGDAVVKSEATWWERARQRGEGDELGGNGGGDAPGGGSPPLIGWDSFGNFRRHVLSHDRRMRTRKRNTCVYEYDYTVSVLPPFLFSPHIRFGQSQTS